MRTAQTLSDVKVAVEIARGGETRWRVIHTFRFPKRDEAGFYRSILSLESFRNGAPPKRDAVIWQPYSRKMPPSWRKHCLFRLYSFVEFIDESEQNYTRFERRGYPVYDERIVPDIRHHDDLWAFYEDIGWDYKKRVYRDRA